MVKNEYEITVRLSVSDKNGDSDISGLPNEEEMEESIHAVIKEGMPSLLSHYMGRLLDLQVTVREITAVEVLSTIPPAPQAVLDALAHVRQICPNVDRVVFTPDGSWEYTADGFAPVNPTGKSADPHVLKAAADAVSGPAVFFVTKRVPGTAL